MPLPVITDTLRVAVEGTANNNHHWANIMHFRKTSALTYTGAIAVLDPILVSHYSTDSGAGKAWKSHASNAWAIVDFRYTPLDGTSVSVINNHSIVGVITASEGLPPSIALVATLRTAKRGRSYRGRVYEGAWTEASNQPNGAPSSADAAALAAQWNQLIGALTSTGLSLVVASYLHSTADNVVNVTVDTRWDTQRRRLNV
jgi:hypothetical protein